MICQQQPLLGRRWIFLYLGLFQIPSQLLRAEPSLLCDAAWTRRWVFLCVVLLPHRRAPCEVWGSHGVTVQNNKVIWTAFWTSDATRLWPPYSYYLWDVFWTERQKQSTGKSMQAGSRKRHWKYLDTGKIAVTLLVFAEKAEDNFYCLRIHDECFIFRTAVHRIAPANTPNKSRRLRSPGR